MRILFLVAMPEEGRHLQKVLKMKKLEVEATTPVEDDRLQDHSIQAEEVELQQEPIFLDLFANLAFGACTPPREVYLAIPKKDAVHGCAAIGSEAAAVAALEALQILASSTSRRRPPSEIDLVVSAGTCGGIQQEVATPMGTNKTQIRQGDVFVADKIAYLGRAVPFAGYQSYVEGCYPATADPEAVRQAILLGEAEAEGVEGNNEDDQDEHVCVRDRHHQLRVFLGTVATSNSFVTDDAVPLQEGVQVCEMEAAAQARVCFLRGKLPFAAVKIVSDVDSVEGMSAEERGAAFLAFLNRGVENLGRACEALARNWRKCCSDEGGRRGKA
eukprot:g8334.t1